MEQEQSHKKKPMLVVGQKADGKSKLESQARLRSEGRQGVEQSLKARAEQQC